MTVALTLLAGMSGTAACSSSGDDALTYWAVNMGPTLKENQQILERELGQFTERSGIEVDLEVLNWPELYSRIMTAITSGREPDVLDIGNTWSASLQDTGALMVFDDKTMSEIGGADRFLPPTLTATGAAGEPSASVPFLGQSYGLYYNTKLFASAGIDGPPRTWDEFLADAETLTGGGQWGISLPAASTAINSHLAFMLGRQHGANLFATDGVAQFNTPALRAAVRNLIDLMVEHEVMNPTDAESSGLTDPLAALADGQVAMVPAQSGGRTYLAAIGFDDYAVAPLPMPEPLQPNGASVQSIVAGTNLAVAADTDRPDDALELVRFLTSDEEQVVLNKAFGTLPVVHDAYDDPAFRDPVTQMFGTILRDRSETMPMVAAEGQMEQLLGGALRDLWADAATGEVTDGEIATALAKAEQQMPGPEGRVSE